MELNNYDNIAGGEVSDNYEDNRIALKIAVLRLNDFYYRTASTTISPEDRKYNYDEFSWNIIYWEDRRLLSKLMHRSFCGSDRLHADKPYAVSKMKK